MQSLAQNGSTGGNSEWEARLIAIVPNSVDGARAAQALMALDPDSGFAILKETWPKIQSAETRLFLLNMLQEHPRVLDILDLGVTDSSLAVQDRALLALENFSFESFSEDFSSYGAWRKKQVGRTLEATMRESCRDYLKSLQNLDEAARFQRLALLQRIGYNLGASVHTGLRRKAMIEAGLPEALAVWIANPSTAWVAFGVLRNLKMDEAYLRKVMVPLLDPKADPNLRNQALGVIATPDNQWAAGLLLKMFVQEYPDPASENLGYALTQVAEARSIPTLIGMIVSDKSPDGQRVLGNMLNLITGNAAGSLRDGDWWRNWWTRNAGRFPPDVRGMAVPQIAVRPRFVSPPLSAGPEQHQISGDVKRTYWLVSPNGAQARRIAAGGAQPPAPPGSIAAQPGEKTDSGSPGLLVVLPPDGNGAAASLFWQEMERKALRNRYYVAVVTAPKWVDNQAATWITADNITKTKEAKFTTERFVAEIVEDVAASHSLQVNRIFLHGAAESGPAAYACSLEETTPFKGFYILASPFKSAGLPPLSRAKNRRYLIQHSSDDKQAPFIMAAAAQKLLSEHGAAAKLDPYKGAHGYVFADADADPIGGAISWLEGGLQPGR